MFKYVNPGYGELCTLTPGTTLKTAQVNPINKVGFECPDPGEAKRTGNISFPVGTREVWVKCDFYFIPNPDGGGYTDAYNRVYVGNIQSGTVKTGVYVNSPTEVDIMNNGTTQNMHIKTANMQDGKLHTFLLHVRAIANSYDKSLIEVSLDGVSLYSKKGGSIGGGYVNNGEEITQVGFIGGPNTVYSNIICADYDISQEQVVEIPIKSESSDFETNSDGSRKISAVGQKSTAELDFGELDSAIVKSMVLGQITSISAGLTGFTRDSTKVNGMQIDLLKDGTTMATAENLMKDNNGVMGPTFVKTMAASEISKFKIVATAKML